MSEHTSNMTVHMNMDMKPMPLPEIEFELSADQYASMGYPGLRQGQALSLVLDAGVLIPDPVADSWYTVRPEPLSPQLAHVGPALYAFAGQIVDADLQKDETGSESAVVLVNCGFVHVRVTCAPREDDGRLPWGTWETRYLTGFGRLQGLVEEDYGTAVGRPFGVTIWGFRRLVLAPGDPLFAQWHETDELLPMPFQYDRIFVKARVHRERSF